MSLLITGASVFDAAAGATQPHQTIRIADGLISAVLPAGSAAAAPQPGDTIVDGTGLTAVPGLIDCHTHLCYDGVPARFSAPAEPPAILTAMAIDALGRHLRAGVTTVRDCGSPDGIAIDLAAAQDLGLISGPRILAAGQMLTMTGGHGSQIGRLVDGVDSATRQTRGCIGQGADFIKVIATGGVVTKGVSPEQTALQPAELAAITRAAHDAGKLVTAHVTGAQGARNAIAAGIDTLEHAHRVDADTAAFAAAHNVSVVPTLCAIAALSEHLAELPGWMAEKVPPLRQLHHASFRRVVEAGLLFGAGTDGGTPFNQHGSLATELECMVELGVSPAAALRAATISAARIVGREREIGSLAAGKNADLVLVEGDPAASISAMREIRAVYFRGDLVHSATGLPGVATGSR